MIRVSLLVLLSAVAQAESPVRELLYAGAATQTAPLYDKGYLVCLNQPNRLEVYRPGGQVAFTVELPCPGTGTCTAGAVSVDSRGLVAVSFGYMTQKGRAAGIRILSPEGRELRFIETGGYVPTMLSFDRNNDLWSLGWQRDPYNPDFEEKSDYAMVRKFSSAGKEIGRYLPRSLWPAKKSQPHRSGRGVWRMAAASDRIGAIIHEGHADNPTEWIEWNLSGNILSRTLIPKRLSAGRAYSSDGLLYGRFRVEGSKYPELRVLDTAKGNWVPVGANLPENAETDGAFLIGADGKELVYLIGAGNTRLLWARPGNPQ